jgi:hypothetical protein
MPTGSLIQFVAITKNFNTVFYFRQWWMSRNSSVTDRNCVWLLSQLYGVLQLQLQPEEINSWKPDAFTRAARFDTWNPGFRPQVYLRVTTFFTTHSYYFPMQFSSPITVTVSTLCPYRNITLKWKHFLQFYYKTQLRASNSLWLAWSTRSSRTTCWPWRHLKWENAFWRFLPPSLREPKKNDEEILKT